MKWIGTVLLLHFGFLMVAQTNGRMNVQFIDFQNPLTGGFEAPQIQAINLNDDGHNDLLVFDRKGSVIRTFIYDESAPFYYTYAPEYESIFPDIPCWVIVRDYDNDGVDDLFTCGVSDPVTGIEVWKGKRVNDELSFEVYNHPHGAYNIIYYERNDDFKQLYVGNNGIPGIADVDDDGDIDILAFQPSGGYLYYFKNMSQERGFASDSLIFTREDDCWGNFYEGGLIPDIILSEKNGECALPSVLNTTVNRHEGITVSIFDRNQDGKKDLLLGEVSSSHLIFVENGGTKDDAFAIYKENNFPNDNVPAEMQIFLASFVLDADQDGIDDLLVAPNSQFGTNTEQVSFYKGVDSSFNLMQEDWLVGTTLDFGTDAYPSFVDYNADGLLDIVIGSFGLIGKETGTETRLYLFENIGTLDQPVYQLKDDNYLDFNAYNEFDKSFTPSFGDLDGDGDVDLVLGTLSGEILYAENTAGAGNAVAFSDPIFAYKMLDSENNTIKVAIADLNTDNLGDIVVGGRNSFSLSDGIGSLKLFTNIGSAGAPDFSNSASTLGFGAVNVKDAGSSKVSASPKFYLQGDRPLLFVGNETGRIAVYEVNFNGDDFVLIDDDLLEEYFGRRVAIDVADIDNDGFLEIVAGNERGGLNFYNTVIQASGEISSVGEDESNISGLKFFPNPVAEVLYFPEDVQNIKIYNTIGELVIHANGPFRSMNVSILQDGAYYVLADGKSGKFIKTGR